MNNNLIFDNLRSEYVKDCFLEAYQGFPALHKHQLEIRANRISDTAMRARPILNRHFWRRGSRQYRVEISNHVKLDKILGIREMPREVLVGWFAHELGHVMDYLPRTIWSLLNFLIGYLFFAEARRGAERQADLFAIEAGYADQLIATKKFILSHSDLPASYRANIEKYYLSPEEIAMLLEREETEEIRMDKLV